MPTLGHLVSSLVSAQDHGLKWAGSVPPVLVPVTEGCPPEGGSDRAPCRQHSRSGAAVCCFRVLVSGRGLHAGQGALSGGVHALSSGVLWAQLPFPPLSPALSCPLCLKILVLEFRCMDETGARFSSARGS